ncbi:MAG: restriction endonuclease subunit S, partial [Candidatus Acinetobacter avistercoris]|nr:restriction endonuclease subunit S [Candidatus Acinetobacter avistercoris]
KDALLRKGKLQKNDLVITTRGTVGNIAYFDESIPFENIRINSGMVIVRSEIDLEPIYLNQFLKSDLFEKWLEKNVFGSAQPQLTVKLLNSISISYPSKEEQTKIASFLSAVDEKISQLTKKNQLLSQYKQGMMQKLFSQQLRFKADDGSEFGEWEEKKLGDICSHFQSGKTITSATISDNGAYPVFGGNGLRGFTDTYTHDGIFALIGRQGALCGNINLVQGENFISEHAIAVQANQESSTQWLAIWLDFMQLNRFSESSAQAGLAVNKLVKFDIKVPCLEEQTKIANFLSVIDQKIEVVAQQIEQAKTWKKGLLQQMFV